jgi:hypothetical protein
MEVRELPEGIKLSFQLEVTDKKGGTEGRDREQVKHLIHLPPSEPLARIREVMLSDRCARI